MIIKELQDCEKPDSLGVSASIFSIQLAALIFNLDISEKSVHDLIDQYIEQFSGILNPEEKNGVRHFIGANMHIYSKALSKEDPARWMHVATNCIFEFTETPYDPADAVMVTTCILYFVAEATPYFPKDNIGEAWSNKSISKQIQPPKKQSNVSQAKKRSGSLFSSDTLSRVAVPSFILAVVTLVIRLTFSIQTIYIDDFGAILVEILITEIFAFLTCYPFVIARGKTQGHVWANYIIWMLLLNLGSLVQYFGW